MAWKNLNEVFVPKEQYDEEMSAVQDSISYTSVSLSPNTSLANYSTYSNSSFRVGDVVTVQAAIVLSKDTTFSSSQLRLFTLDESHAPASAKTFNRMLLAVSTDGYVSAKSFKVEGTALSFTQSGSTENIRTIVIPGISYTVK